MCCCIIRTAVHIYCCVRTRRGGGVERRGEAKTVISAPLWHGSAYHCYFFVFVFVRYTLPCLWHSSAYFLLYCCTAVVLLSYTHCGFVGCSWMFFSLLCAVLYYAVLRTAVVKLYGVAGWIGSCFFSVVFFSPLYRPRTGVVRRTTSTCKYNSSSRKRQTPNSRSTAYLVRILPAYIFYAVQQAGSRILPKTNKNVKIHSQSTAKN